MSEGSIHPRVALQGPKKNTCKPRNNNRKGKLGKAAAKLLMRRNAHSATLKTPGINASAFRSPGSMNQRS
jgi:hypothetical protein